jgi:hypothetical protein
LIFAGTWLLDCRSGSRCLLVPDCLIVAVAVDGAELRSRGVYSVTSILSILSVSWALAAFTYILVCSLVAVS